MTKNKIQNSSVFKLIKSGFIKIPNSYLHSKQLSTLPREKFWFIKDQISDNNFEDKVDIFEPGKKYKVRIYKVNEDQIKNFPEQCRNFMIKKNSMFTGPYGLSIIWQLNRRLISGCNLWMVSFDKRNDEQEFACISLSSKRKWFFSIHKFSPDASHCLLIIETVN